MLPLYRALLLGFLASIVVSYVQGARSSGASPFLWACAGAAIFVLGLVVFGVAINALTPGSSAIDSLIGTLTLTCGSLLIALFARTKLLPGSPLFSFPKRIPIVPVSVVTIGVTCLLVASQLNRSMLVGVVSTIFGPAAGGRASQLELMATVANVRGTLVLIAVVGWILIAAHLALRSREKERGIDRERQI